MSRGLRLACARWLLACMAPLAGAAAVAETYPARPVTIVVPTTTGGTADILARLIGPKLTALWGQPVVVENRSGAGTLIGTEFAARAQPDGYTLMITYSELATLPALNKNARIDVVKDLTRVGKIGSLPVLILAHPSMPANTMDELVARLRADPGKYSYASNGIGSALQLYTEMFRQAAKVDIMHVPYRGALEASRAVLGGEVDLLVQLGNGNVIGYVTSGKAKAYAVASPQRLAALPDVPTTAEAGLPGLQLEAWYGLFAPAGLPPERVEKLNRDLATVLAMPDIRDRLVSFGMQVQPGTPQQFDAFFHDEYQRWTRLIEDAGIQIN
ncbi:tripartite tricarboxylate transporter substrate binding protein [Bordetella bronchiseptica]|uniref:tripartite tricarboxylate transporter substrate binding protein n=1 Tax=Bordetella bronchiseptica TaxID=518 RepID=UPI001F2F39E0|nr:tripartite tricarboxylate transporter substrate binding protein [Bordetella bronchiseptica]